MTSRICIKCGDGLEVNGKLGLMECISGRHVEPINLIRPQWWNMCPACGQVGLNDVNQEPSMTVTPDSYTCRACRNIFTKV